MPLELTLTNEQKVLVSVTPVTAAGHPAPLDGPVTFTVESGGVTLHAIDDTSAELVSSDTDFSDSLVSVSADADIGEGVETIQDSVLVHSVHAHASSLGLTAGTPELK